MPGVRLLSVRDPMPVKENDANPPWLKKSGCSTSTFGLLLPPPIWMNGAVMLSAPPLDP